MVTVEHKLELFAAVVTLLIKLIRIFLKWKYIQNKHYAISAAMYRKRSDSVKKVASWLPRLECSYHAVAKTEILVSGLTRPLI